MSYVITGATGQIGSAAIDYLLLKSVPIRAVIRSENKSTSFTSRNIEVAIADLTDADALTKAFKNAKAVFAMNPTAVDSPDMIAAARRVSDALAIAVKANQVPRVVVLSSVGSEKNSGTGDILTTNILENALKDIAPQVVMVRCAWFMENWLNAVSAVKAGHSPVLGSLLQRLDQKLPHIATDDIGYTVSEYLTKPIQQNSANLIIELEGPEPYSPKDVAEIVSQKLGRNIPVAALSESMIHEMFGKFGWSKANIDNLIEMARGFDNDTICWANDGTFVREKGRRTLEQVLMKVLN